MLDLTFDFKAQQAKLDLDDAVRPFMPQAVPPDPRLQQMRPPMPMGGMMPQGMPPQGMPPQGMPPQGMPMGGPPMPPQGMMPQGMPMGGPPMPPPPMGGLQAAQGPMPAPRPFAKGGGVWTRKEGQNPEGGLNAKGRASLKAQGHDIKPPVSAKQAKKSPKAAGRRKSFCARMSGMPGPMKDEKGRPTRKALSLRKWDC